MSQGRERKRETGPDREGDELGLTELLEGEVRRRGLREGGAPDEPHNKQEKKTVKEILRELVVSDE